MVMSDHSGWHPPLALPPHLLDPARTPWRAQASVNLRQQAMFIKLEGGKKNKKFLLPFQNILASKNKPMGEVWPPNQEQLSKCGGQLLDWRLDICLRPQECMKATILDPWKKAYLVTIPIPFNRSA